MSIQKLAPLLLTAVQGGNAKGCFAAVEELSIFGRYLLPVTCADESSDRAPCMRMQVQEGALDWLLSVLSATVMHIGPQLLPYKQRLKALLDAFFALPSKVSPQQQSVAGCLAVSSAKLGTPAHQQTNSAATT